MSRTAVRYSPRSSRLARVLTCRIQSALIQIEALQKAVNELELTRLDHDSMRLRLIKLRETLRNGRWYK